MSEEPLSPEEKKEKQELESWMRTSQILNLLRSLSLPAAAVGSLLAIAVGPAALIAGAALGAGGILAARAFNRTKVATVRKTLEELHAKGSISSEQYEKAAEILNSAETEGPR